MSVSVCKLYRNTLFEVPPCTWTLVTFDSIIQNDRNMAKDKTLIVPPLDGPFIWGRNVRWEDIEIPEGDIRPRQFMDRFVRILPDGKFDDTGADDTPDTPGRDWGTVMWGFAGEAGQPVGLQVWHDHSDVAFLGHAQFQGISLSY